MDPGRAGHTVRHLPHEVEGLVLGLAEIVIRQIGGTLGDGREPGLDRTLAFSAQVREPVVVAGEPVEGARQRVGVEGGLEELGGEIVGGHPSDATARRPEPFGAGPAGPRLPPVLDGRNILRTRVR